MTPAEQATAMAEQGAREHHTETTPDCWTGTLISGDDFKADPRFNWDTLGDGCEKPAPGEPGVCCTRLAGHPGRHIATGGVYVMAAWPGTHEPTLADLDDPQPEPKAPDLADCERRVPAPLTLPDGWEQFTRADGAVSYCRHVDPEGRFPNLYAEVRGVDVGFASSSVSPETARALAARLVEAAGIVEQLRGGVR